MSRFSQPQVDVANAIILTGQIICGSELSIDDLAKVIAKAVHPDSLPSLIIALTMAMAATEKVHEERQEQQDRKRRNSHA